MPEQKILAAGPGFMDNEANQGSWQAGAAGVKEGWARTVVGTLARSADYLYLREMGKTPLTQESYDKRYKDAFKFDPKMTEEEAWARYRDKLQDGVRAADMGGHETAAFAGSLAGSIFSLDLPLFAAVPEVKMLNLAGTTGKVGAELLASNAARFSGRRLVDNVTNASLNAGLQNMALEPFIYGADQWIGRKHGLDDTALNTLAGFGLGAVIGVGKTAWRAYSPDVRQAMSRRALQSSLNGETVDSVLGAMGDGETNAAAKTAHEVVGREVGATDTPNDISASEIPAELRQRAYAEEPTDTPQQAAERRDLRAKITRRNVLDSPSRKEAAASFEERTKAFRDSARRAVSEDEHLLNESFKRIFGTEVMFSDSQGGEGLYGIFNPKEPGRIYIRSGALDGEGVTMLRIAGHEMGHVIRARDPHLWIAMADAMSNIRTNRHFADSYREVVSAKKASGLWKYMTYHEKMDETYATVLGHAMQTPDFWVSLNKTAQADGRKLAGYLLKAMDALESAKIALGRDETARGKIAPMEAQLAKAVSALNESGQYKFATKKEAVSAWERALNPRGAPLGSDKKPVIFQGYSRLRDRFFRMEQDALAPLAYENMTRSRKLEAIDGTLNWLFSDAGNMRATLRDKSGSRKLVKTFTRGAYDPRALLVNGFYGNMDGRAREAFNKMLRSLSAKKDLPEAFDMGPLATYRATGAVDKNGAPVYEFNIYHDDKHPMWSENRKPEDFGIDDHEMMVQEHSQQLAEMFVPEARRLAGDPESVALIEGYRDEIRGYLEGLDEHDFAEMSVQDLIDGFNTHLDEQMRLALAQQDEKRYGNLVDMRSEDRPPAASADEEASSVEAKAAHEKLVREAWEKAQQDFQKTGQQPDWVKNWEEFDPDKNYYPPEILTGDVLDHGVEGAYKILRGEMFKERMEMMSEDNPALYDLYSKHMSDAEKERFHEELYQAIDKAIYDTQPNLRAAMDKGTQQRLAGKEQTPIMTNADWLLEGDPLDDLDWQGMEMPLPEALQAADAAQGELRAQSEAAVSRALEQLRANHTRYAPWLEDVFKRAQKDMPDLLKRNNLTDFEVEDTPLAPGEVRPPAPERTNAEEKLLGVISGHKKSMRAALKDLDNLVSGKPRERGDKAPETDYAKERFDLHMRLQNGDRWAAAEAARTDTKSYYVNKIRGELLAHEAGNRIRSLARKSPKHLFSALDSQPRVGVRGAGLGLDAIRRAQAIADLTPLDQLLARYGLRDHWKNNSLVQAVLNYIDTGEAKTTEVKLLGDTLRQTVDMQAGRINSLGGVFRFLPKFAFSQVHDGAKITSNPEAWRGYLNENLDWARVEKFVGKMDTQVKRDAYLDGVFELVTKRMEDPLALEEAGGNILNETSLRRTLHFKPGKGFEYDMAFGSGNTGAEIMSQIIRRAEKAAIMDFAGPKYKATWSAQMASMGVQFANKFSDLRNMDETFRQITGEWDHPIDKGMASISRGIRQTMNSAALWLGGISSATDIGNIVSTLRWAGVEPKDLHGRVLSALVEGARTESGRQVLQGQGAGMQALMGAYSRLIGNSSFERTAQKLSDFTFKYSGTELTTKLYQEAMFDFMSQHLGSMSEGPITPEFKNWLDHYQITSEEWSAMAGNAGTVEGLSGKRLAPDMVKNTDLALKLRAALHDTMAYGQLQPSVSDEALLRMGTKAGTWSGEAVRLIGQYKGYPLAVVNKVRARFKYGYGSVDAPVMGVFPKGRGMEESLAWSASMIVLAWLALGVKDALRGNEPMNPLEADHWNFGNLTRILGQAGTGPVATIEQFASPSQALGPALGSAYRIGKAMGDDTPGSGYRKTEAVFGSLPGASLAPLQQARKQIIGSVFSDAYMTAMERAQEFREEKTGQERLLDFRD